MNSSVGFRKKAIPAVIAALSASALAQEPIVREEVIVTGVRQSIERSLDVKRDAASVVDVISAEDIGKLPDTTIVDSLQRVSGVQIERSAGEGSRVSVRGSANVALMLNGEQFLSAGNLNGVQPDLTDVPSTMVSAVQVLKSATASTLTGGLTGTIDLQTHRPFMLEEGRTLMGQVNLGTGSRTKSDDFGIQGFAGYNAGRWGAAVNIAYSDLTLGDDIAGSNGDEGTFWYGLPDESSLPRSSQITPPEPVTPLEPADLNGNNMVDRFFQSQGFQATARENQRKRLALSTSGQLAINDALTLTGDMFFTDMEQSRRHRSFRVEGAWSWDWANPVLGERRVAPAGAGYGDLYSVQEWQLNMKRVMPNSGERLDDRSSLNTNLELAYDNGGPWTGSVRYVHGRAENVSTSFEADAYISDGSPHGATFRHPDGTTELVNIGGYPGEPILAYDGSEGLNEAGESSGLAIPGRVSFSNDNVHFELPDGLGQSLSQYGLVSNHLAGQTGDATLDVLRLDGSFQAERGVLNSVDFGVRLGRRKVDYQDWINIALFENQDDEPYGVRWKDADVKAPYSDPAQETPESPYRNIKFEDPRLRDYVVQESNFPGVTGMPALYFLDIEKMDARAFTNSLFPNNFDYADPGQSYKVAEETQTAYLQLNLLGEVWDKPYSGNIGLRYVRTELETTSHNVGNVVTGQTTYEYQGVDYLMGAGWDSLDLGTYTTPNKYDDFLPSLNLALNLTDDQILRFAYNKAMTMHDLGNLGRGLKVWRSYQSASDVFTVDRAEEVGNPLLPPQRSTNFDLSYEWYFAEGGLLNLAVFYRENNTALQTLHYNRDDLPDSDGVIRNTEVDTTYLAVVPGGYSKGFEVGYQQAMSFLPGFMRNFGVGTNYTYSPSEGSQPDFYGNLAPEGNNSEHQTNLVLWYETERFSARLAHNWRSERLEWVEEVWGTPISLWRTPTQDLSFSGAYYVTDNVTVRLDATNLLEEESVRYLQWTDQRDKFFITERRINLSLQVNL